MAKERSFRRYSYEDVKRRASSRGGGFDSFIKPNFKMYKVKDGKNLIRILPAQKDADHFGLQIWVNYSVGPDNQSYLSLSKMLKKPDPLAEALRELDRTSDEDAIRQLRPKERYLYWLIDRDAPEDGPQLWAAPITFDRDLANMIIDEDTKEVTYIDDPETGNDLRFYRENQGEFKIYPASKIKVMPPTVLSEDDKEFEAWVKFVEDNPLPETLQYYDYDHIAGVFNGQSKKPETVEDEAEVAPAPRKAKRAEPEPDEDEAEEPPFEVDERPSPKAKARPRLEPDEDDEDEDEEPPVRGKAAKAARATADEEGGSIRERIQSRRRQAQAASED